MQEQHDAAHRRSFRNPRSYGVAGQSPRGIAMQCDPLTHNCLDVCWDIPLAERTAGIPRRHAPYFPVDCRGRRSSRRGRWSGNGMYRD
jgi:hypothetical protein